jgi:hypothetical protein
MFACVFPHNIFNELDDFIKLDKNIILFINTMPHFKSVL